MRSEDGRPLGRVYAGLVLTMAFWGSAFATSKMLVLEVPPEVGAVLRFGLGSLLMLALLFRRGGGRSRRNVAELQDVRKRRSR